MTQSAIVIPEHVRQRATAERQKRAAQAKAIAPTVSDKFGIWLAEHEPEPETFQWTADHFLEMQALLDDVTAGIVRRAYFSLPIRHGKTEHNSIRYAAYRLELNPKTRIIVASYSQVKANKISRAIRRLTRQRGVRLSNERDAAFEWETAAGGGVRAVGAKGGVAGENADLIIIDDPIGSRADAESEAEREQVWDWITNDLLARCEPHTAVLFTMSRWHSDDPAGRLIDQQSDLWEIIDLPGESFGEDQDLFSRPKGEPLWPEKRPKTWLIEKRRELNEYGFASLIQGRPRPRQGGMFQWDWWQMVNAVPRTGSMVRYWDLAGTLPKKKKSDPDYSSGSLLCRMVDERTAVVNITRFRKSVAERDATLLAICKSDLKRYPHRVTWWIEKEAGIDGERRTTSLMRKLQNLGMSVYTEHPTGNKVLRAEPLASKAQVGNIVFCPDVVPGDPRNEDWEHPWHDDFRLEAADFPNGKHDDQVDSTDGADAKLDEPTASVGTSTVRV